LPGPGLRKEKKNQHYIKKEMQVKYYPLTRHFITPFFCYVEKNDRNRESEMASEQKKSFLSVRCLKAHYQLRD
jgi:hypothetical protein